MSPGQKERAEELARELTDILAVARGHKAPPDLAARLDELQRRAMALLEELAEGERELQ